MLAAVPTIGRLFAEWRHVGQNWEIETVNTFPGGKVLLHNNAGSPTASDEASAPVAAKFKPSAVFHTAGAGRIMFNALSDCIIGAMYRFFNL